MYAVLDLGFTDFLYINLWYQFCCYDSIHYMYVISALLSKFRLHKTSWRLARNVTAGYYCTDYVRVFPTGHKWNEKK